MVRSRHSRFAAAASLPVLVFAVVQASATLQDTPAFNRDLQVQGPGGAPRPLLTRAMYDQGEYYYQTAFAYANYTASLLLKGMDPTDLTVEDMRERSRLARINGERSLEHNPGNVHAWMLLASTFRSTGEPERAWDAMRISTELAPYSTSLAYRRILFVGGDRSGIEQGEWLEAAIERDIRVLRNFQPRTIGVIESRYPDLLSIGEDAQ